MANMPAYLGEWEPSKAQRAIVAKAALSYDVSVEAVLGKRRTDDLWRARQASYWALKQRWPNLTYPQLAKIMGATDHSTAIHNVRRAEEVRESDEHFRAVTEALVEGAPVPSVRVPVEEIDAAAAQAEADRVDRLLCAARHSIVGEAEPGHYLDPIVRRDEKVGLYYAEKVALGSSMLLQALRKNHPERFLFAA